MGPDYIQTLRYKLQRRVRRLNSTGFKLFHFGLQQLWGFLKSHPFLQGILDGLSAEADRVKADVDTLITGGKTIAFASEKDQVLASYLVLKHCAESDNQQVEIQIAQRYSSERKLDDILEAFRDVFVEPLYDYLDEAVDERGATLSALRRYKHRCEWFRRDQLFQLWSSDSQRGEKRLALDLYEYLFEQGIDFHIEPGSASGEADLVSSQVGGEPLIADAKIFNAEKGKGKAYIIKAFNQIYTYTLDYNEPFGFLVIFKTGEQALQFALRERAGVAPFVTHNHKTIFFVVIDLYAYETTASQRGAMRSIEITEQDLVGGLRGEGAERHTGEA